jgi:peptidylprolyl isomerase
MRLRLLALAALLVLALAAAGCGSDDNNDSSGSSTPKAEGEQPAQTAETETETEAAANPKDTSVKPVIDKPTGSPPKKLVVEDIVRGKGKPAKAGDTVSVQYVGVSFSNGQQFDASWDRGQPFSFQLGTGGVIGGWDKGLVGMKAGGRRKLTIPPELGYGAQGTPDGSIAPNETLVFVVDLEQIN